MYLQEEPGARLLRTHLYNGQSRYDRNFAPPQLRSRSRVAASCSTTVQNGSTVSAKT